jgi:hypothetical protein
MYKVYRLTACGTCACVWAQVCMWGQVCTYTHRYVGPGVYIYIYIYIYIYTDTYMYKYTIYQKLYVYVDVMARLHNVCIGPNLCMYIRLYMCTYIHTYIHTHIHTYIYTYVHTDIHTYKEDRLTALGPCARAWARKSASHLQSGDASLSEACLICARV